MDAQLIILNSSASISSSVTPLDMEPTNDMDAFYRSLLRQAYNDVHPFDNRYCCYCSKSHIGTYLSYITAGIVSLPSVILYVALTLQDEDLPSHTRWIIALCEGLLIFVQCTAVIQVTIKRYFHYATTLLQAIKNGRQGLFSLIKIPQDGTRKHKIYEAFKNIASFLGLEGFKWTILSFSYALPVSVIKQVSFLENMIFTKILICSTMATNELPIHKCLYSYQPTWTSCQIIQSEKNKLRETFYQLIQQAALHAQDHLHSEESQQIYRWIMAPISEISPENISATFLKTLLAHQQRSNALLSQNIFYVKYLILVAVLISIYVSSNSANFRAIWENHKISFFNSLGSTLCEICFGFFMSDNIAHRVFFHTLGRAWQFLKYEWRKILIALFGIIFTIPSVFSAITVSRHEHMSFFVGIILTSLGTLFDQSYFLIESGIRLERQHVLRNIPHNQRHQRAAIACPYRHLLEAFQHLSDQDFIEYLNKAIKNNRPAADAINAYTSFFHKKLPWSCSFSSTEIIALFQKPNSQLLAIINHSQEFGLKRRVIEYTASLIASGIIVINGLLVEFHTLPSNDQYFLPLLAIPAALACIKLLDYRRRSYVNLEYIPLIERNADNNSADELQPLPPCRTIQRTIQQRIQDGLIQTFKYGALMAAPLILHHASKIAGHWVAIHIFKQPPEEARKYNELVATSITALGIGILTKKIGISLRQPRYDRRAYVSS
jgi:hypothetical protein